MYEMCWQIVQDCPTKGLKKVLVFFSLDYNWTVLCVYIFDKFMFFRDILEWNGYEIVDDIVIHTRLMADIVSVGSQDEEWHDNVSNFSDVITIKTKHSLETT